MINIKTTEKYESVPGTFKLFGLGSIYYIIDDKFNAITLEEYINNLIDKKIKENIDAEKVITDIR